jgi:hypothetical protein
MAFNIYVSFSLVYKLHARLTFVLNKYMWNNLKINEMDFPCFMSGRSVKI